MWVDKFGTKEIVGMVVCCVCGEYGIPKLVYGRRRVVLLRLEGPARGEVDGVERAAGGGEVCGWSGWKIDLVFGREGTQNKGDEEGRR